jgi:hypothetical protein
MRYVESKTDPQMHVCECPEHGLFHFGPKTDLTEGPPHIDQPPDDREHDRLKRITQDLEREHRALHDIPHDREAHAAHRDKLRQHIQDLHAHIERLKSKR